MDFPEQSQLKFTFDGPLALMSVQEIFEQASVSLFLKLREDRRIERKSAGIHPQQIGDYLSMWANTAPDGGVLVVGMEDDGAVSGCPHADHQDTAIGRCI